MTMKISAYRSNNYKDGETITISICGQVLFCSASDIYHIIVKLTEAKQYAINAEVGDEPRNFNPNI